MPDLYDELSVQHGSYRKDPTTLPKSNKKDVKNVRAGASRQHFLSFDSMTESQDSNRQQLTADSWPTSTKTDEGEEEKETNELFSTELNEEMYEHYPNGNFLPERWTMGTELKDTLQNVTQQHCKSFFDKALTLFEQHNYEESLVNINKCLLLKPYYSQFYEMRAELYLELCDFQSALMSLQKIILSYQATAKNEQQQQPPPPPPPTTTTATTVSTTTTTTITTNREEKELHEKILFSQAISIIANAGNMFSLPFQLYSILCLNAINKVEEATTLISQIIEQYPQNPDLLIVRARLYYREKSKLALCFYDIRDALLLNETHAVARKMMITLKQTSSDLRDSAVHTCIIDRLTDALALISLAIDLYPIEAEYHLQRSIIYRKMKKFELASDECLLVFDKLNHDEQHRLYQQAQKQFVFIYNATAIKCLEKNLYDEAIELLNRAIKDEKSTCELYMNRGDCFLAKGQITFAIQDYEQALELMPNNEVKLRISHVFFTNAEKQYKEKHYSESCAQLTKAIDVNPSVAKYYVSRSRVKYLMEDIFGAQEDIIAAILINPLENECIDVLPRLFPDTTLAQVLKSALTKEVKKKLLEKHVKLAIR
ncbi:unnamed protein product [Didymodactylos carnosus]|uniref:Tetratricopeptide repeat-containing protein n=1 Tax=Didymodactylos carnosus TaxID=1234261 RepID=A0A813Q5G4_9BILA|nr:unnamed protein product [Didymodactylos carnosus]CAF3543294.1 unnamed protein product [Didymodactylos carnosus]